MAMRLSLPLLLLISLNWACSGPAQESSEQEATPQTASADLSQFAVASSQPLATQTGLDVLEKGGNAFDAAIAVATTLGVVEPQHSGLGGYGSMLIFDAAIGKAKFLSFSGKYPEQLDKSALKPTNAKAVENRNGSKATTTPTLLAGLVGLHEVYGSQAWPDLLDPATQLAIQGFAIEEELANDISSNYAGFSDYAQSVYGSEGAPLKTGDQLVQSDLGRSLKVISERGASVWGDGDIAEAVIGSIRQSGGYLSADDLSAMESNWYEPLSIPYNGYEVVTSGTPTAGFSALQRIGEMGLYNLPSIGINTSAYLHLLIEVSKHAYWTYLRFGGSVDTILPNTGMILSKEYWEWMAENIRPDSAVAFYPPFDFEYISDASNTTHFVVADAAGNMVSATLSLGDVFGSKLMPAGAGFWMNNGAKFATFEQDKTPRDANPGRERVVMDSPMLLFKNGQPVAGFGSPGGGQMPEIVAQAALNMTDFGKSITEALSEPMIYFDPSGIVYYEEGLSEAVVENLQYMGHQLEPTKKIGRPAGVEVIYDASGQRSGYVTRPGN